MTIGSGSGVSHSLIARLSVCLPAVLCVPPTVEGRNGRAVMVSSPYDRAFEGACRNKSRKVDEEDRGRVE